MLRNTKKQPQTVAEKVSKLLAHPNGSDSEIESDIDVDTAARVEEFEDEYELPDKRSTEFRKRNVKLLFEQSDRYKGKISSRKELEQERSSGEEDKSDDDDEDDELAYEDSDTDEKEAENLKAFNDKLKASKVEDENADSSMDDNENESQNEDEEEDADEEEDDNETEDGESESDSENTASEEDGNEVMTKTNQQAEVQKGLCVQNQLRVWERLLELRINTQKFTSKANQLPPPETLATLSQNNEELQTVLNEAQERSSKLLQQLLALQTALTQQHSDLRQSVKRKQLSEESTEPASKRFANVIQSNFENMRSYRNEVLLKWDDRTKLSTPGAGGKRKSMQEDYDIIKKIDNALANREELVEKSQIPKYNQQQTQSNADNPSANEEEPTEKSQRQTHIYDDSDFYHQQLRELIEYKASSTSSMSEITKQFVELQKLRQKMKKKVDTRASKGRKLRYVVHNKLINFMAPNDDSEWTDETKTELFRSLFV